MSHHITQHKILIFVNTLCTQGYADVISVLLKAYGKLKVHHVDSVNSLLHTALMLAAERCVGVGVGV